MLWTQPTANLGNFLYDWMHAWTYRRRGEDIVCLVTPKVEPWLPVFGAIAEPLVVRREEVRLTDRREKGLYAEFGVAFDVPALEAFASGFLAETGLLDPDRVPPAHRLGEHDLLVSVRRGDYASVEEFRQRYAFDLDEYLRVALAEQQRVAGPIGRIQVVSDGIDWCVEHLDWLAGHAERLTFETEGLPPEVHLAMLANAPRLVVPNSTFGYWGGYLSAWRSGHPERVVAPWFHARPDNGGAAWQLDPRWTVVRDLPSGWALPKD